MRRMVKPMNESHQPKPNFGVKWIRFSFHLNNVPHYIIVKSTQFMQLKRSFNLLKKTNEQEKSNTTPKKNVVAHLNTYNFLFSWLLSSFFGGDNNHLANGAINLNAFATDIWRKHTTFRFRHNFYAAHSFLHIHHFPWHFILVVTDKFLRFTDVCGFSFDCYEETLYCTFAAKTRYAARYRNSKVDKNLRKRTRIAINW